MTGVVCFLFGDSPASEQTERSETSAYKIHTPGNCPEESIQHSGHSESLKSRMTGVVALLPCVPWGLH